MIGQPARTVVVDDNQLHLNALVSSFSSLGNACLPFLFLDKMPDKALIKGARALFFDLHLQGSLKTSDAKQFTAQIASYLSDAIERDHGPYILIIWSEFPNDLDTMQGYLDDLDEWQKPTAWFALPKEKFIDVKEGTHKPDTDLSAEVAILLSKQHGLSALLTWEAEVADAARRTANGIWALSQNADGDDDVSLQQTFGKLALGARGKSEAPNKPGQALMEALIPLLADVLEQSDQSGKPWTDAVKFDKPQNAASPAKINSLLHFDMSNELKPTDRGAMCSIPSDAKTDDGFKKFSGFDQKALLKDAGFADQKFADVLASCEWYLLQLNAACDQASQNNGFLPYALVLSSTEKNSGKQRKQSVWPPSGEKVYDIDGSQRYVFVLGNFVLGLTHEEAAILEPRFRVRDALLNQIAFHSRSNAARPGVIEVY